MSTARWSGVRADLIVLDDLLQDDRFVDFEEAMKAVNFPSKEIRRFRRMSIGRKKTFMKHAKFKGKSSSPHMVKWANLDRVLIKIQVTNKLLRK